MPLFPGTPVMVQKRKGDIWTYSSIVELPECIVHEGCCYKIKLSLGRIITRNSIHVHYTHVPTKTFLADTGKRAELKLNPIPFPEPTCRPVLPNPPR